jgi:TPR repeat protein
VKWAGVSEGRQVAPGFHHRESWLRRAALAGDAQVAVFVDGLYPKYAEDANWYCRAAEAGHPTAAPWLGLLYLTGAAWPATIRKPRAGCARGQKI